MKSAYKISNMLVRDRLQKEDAENIKILEEIEASDVLCVNGTYDHIHLVLELSNVPFKRVNPPDLLNIKLRPDQTVFVNCASSFDPQVARKLAGFVAEGGLLITTDWALQNVIEVAFPEMVRYNKRPSADEVVRIEIMEKEDPVLKGFFDEEKDATPMWWLEGSSYPIEILNKEKVKVLIRSKELGDKYGEDAVMIHFEYGKGEVYHMLSHFYLQRSETRDKKHSQGASTYASAKGASSATMEAFAAMEKEEGLDYGTAQSAATSAEFINRALIKQKKKFSKK